MGVDSPFSLTRPELWSSGVWNRIQIAIPDPALDRTALNWSATGSAPSPE